jgi:hypothetical protein
VSCPSVTVAKCYVQFRSLLKLARFRPDPTDFPLGTGSNPLSAASAQEPMGGPCGNVEKVEVAVEE